jgi:hypothetical protein
MFLVIIFLFMLFILLMSIVMVINPYFIWRITESWKANTTPSEAYFIYQRIGGFIGIIFSLFFLLTFFKSFS